MHISAPTNHQKELPWQEILTCIKQYGKTEIKNTMKNTYAVFLRYEILKVQWRINVVEYCYSLYQFILPSANSYCYFHIVFMCLALYFPMFTLHIPCFPFFLIDHNQNQVLLIKWDIFFEAQKYFFALFNFLKMVIQTTLFRR